MPESPYPLFAIDPGTRKLGWAVLSWREALLASGTLIPRSHLRGQDRLLWFLSRLQDLIQQWRPGVLAYEEFTWRSGANNTEHYVVGRPDMERLLGGIQGLALQPPFPVLMGLLPQAWGQRLVGHPAHEKSQIAWAVNARLGTAFRGDALDNHVADAVGIGLVALDRLRYTQRLQGGQ